MLSTFRSIKYGILIGIAGGVPSRKNDIRLGDVVVSTPSRGLGGVFQYDFFKDRPNARQEHIGALNKPLRVLLSARNSLRKNHLKGSTQTLGYIDYVAQICEKLPQFRSPGVARDILFEPNYRHDTADDTCDNCLARSENIISRPSRERSDPYIHYGIVGSGSRVIKDGITRDTLPRPHDILCFEMEAAGLMDSLPCLVIRGISDYADSHNNKAWHPYAALTAAAYAKEVLSVTSFSRAASPVEKKLLEAVLDVVFVCYPENDRNDLIDVKGKRVPGACEWFLNDPKYSAWSSSTTSEVLVVAGRAGQGKTMLAIHVTEILETVALEKQGTLLYFFCSSKDDKHSTSTTILRSLLFQLLQKNPHLLRLVRSHSTTPNIQNHTISGISPLWRIFVDLLRNGGLGPVYCVVDGLDECDKVSTQQLLTKIGRLRETPIHKLNLLFFHRKGLAWIEDKLGDFPCMDLDSDQSNKTGNDMEKYISYQISELQFETRFSGDTLTKMGTALQAGAQGAFLWVSLVTQGLKGKTELEVGGDLQDVSKDLSGIYRRMVSQIKDEQQVVPVIHWVALSRRPLTVAELITATHVVASETQSAEDILKSRIQSCGLLFKIDGNDFVHFVHQSAKDYLRKYDPLGERSREFFATDDKHIQLAKMCLDWINRFFDPSSRANTPETHPMVDYAILHWSEHLKLGLDSSKDHLNLASPFFQKRSQARIRWWSVYWARTRYAEVPTSFTLLHPLASQS